MVNIRGGEPYDVYIGRANRRYGLAASPWGNPFRVHRESERADSMRHYREWFAQRVASDPPFRAATLKLRGKRLACWCTPKPCHGDIIVEWLERQDD